MPPLVHRVPCLSAMRIVSLVPHATELLFALGLGDDVVAVTHECDFPASGALATAVTRDVLPAGPERGRDRRGRARAHRARRGDLRARRAAPARPRARPHRHPGAVPGVRRQLRRRARGRRTTIASRPRVVALDPHTLGESFGDVRTIAQPTDSRDAALDLVARQRARVDAVRLAVARPSGCRWPRSSGSTRSSSPATGRRRSSTSPAASTSSASPASTPSRARGTTVAAAAPRVVVAMPCGYDAERSHEEASAHADALRARRRRAGRRGRRRGLLLAPRPAPRRRPGAHGPHPAPRPGARARGAALEVEV